MIIACSKEGQLCNRLFHLSHFLAFSLENTIRTWYPFFDDYLPYFPHLSAYTSNSKLISLRSSSLVRFFFNRIWPFIFLVTARHFRANFINADSMFSRMTLNLFQLPQLRIFLSPAFYLEVLIIFESIATISVHFSSLILQLN